MAIDLSAKEVTRQIPTTSHTKKGKMKKDFNYYIDHLKDLHSSKAHDYADGEDPYSNFTAAAKAMGTSSYNYVNGRIAEKQHRLENLMTAGKNPNHESVMDTHQDIAVMSIIAMELLNEIENQGK